MGSCKNCKIAKSEGYVNCPNHCEHGDIEDHGCKFCGLNTSPWHRGSHYDYDYNEKKGKYIRTSPPRPRYIGDTGY